MRACADTLWVCLGIHNEIEKDLCGHNQVKVTKCSILFADIDILVRRASIDEMNTCPWRDAVIESLHTGDVMIAARFGAADRCDVLALTRLGFVCVSYAVSSWFRRCTDEPARR